MKVCLIDAVNFAGAGTGAGGSGVGGGGSSEMIDSVSVSSVELPKTIFLFIVS
jgi:hypothetical protein